MLASRADMPSKEKADFQSIIPQVIIEVILILLQRKTVEII